MPILGNRLPAAANQRAESPSGSKADFFFLIFPSFKAGLIQSFKLELRRRRSLGPNYLQLPVNAPKCPHHNNHHEGAMNFMTRDEEVNYFPSRHDPVRHAAPFPVTQQAYSGKREKAMIPKENNFEQVRFLGCRIPLFCAFICCVLMRLPSYSSVQRQAGESHGVQGEQL